MESIVSGFVISAALLYASFTDFTQFKVYNLLTFPLLFLGLAYGAWTGGWGGLGFAAAGVGMGFVILLIPYLMGGLGAGDVKFVMAMGAWIGPSVLILAIVIGSVVVLLYHVLIVARRTGISGAYENIQLMFYRLTCFGRNLAMDDQFVSVQAVAKSGDSNSRGRLIPFSAMMSIGIVIALAIGYLLRDMQ